VVGDPPTDVGPDVSLVLQYVENGLGRKGIPPIHFFQGAKIGELRRLQISLALPSPTKDKGANLAIYSPLS
jgi:hypothetical protein